MRKAYFFAGTVVNFANWASSPENKGRVSTSSTSPPVARSYCRGRPFAGHASGVLSRETGSILLLKDTRRRGVRASSFFGERTTGSGSYRARHTSRTHCGKLLLAPFSPRRVHRATSLCTQWSLLLYLSWSLVVSSFFTVSHTFRIGWKKKTMLRRRIKASLSWITLIRSTKIFITSNFILQKDTTCHQKRWTVRENLFTHSAATFNSYLPNDIN